MLLRSRPYYDWKVLVQIARFKGPQCLIGLRSKGISGVYSLRLTSLLLRSTLESGYKVPFWMAGWAEKLGIVPAQPGWG